MKFEVPTSIPHVQIQIFVFEQLYLLHQMRFSVYLYHFLKHLGRFSLRPNPDYFFQTSP